MAETAENASARAPRDRSRRRAVAKDPAGRTQILSAAVACILELGFYRASTNEIARRAGVSWGAIQYHFGSREALMLAAVDELHNSFLGTLGERHVEGDTLARRVVALYDLLAEHYGRPIYLASIQIMLNLQHDPDTSPAALEALSEQQRRVADEIARLLTETLGPDADDASRSALFHAIRGFAISSQLAESVAPKRTGRYEAEARRFFLAGLVAAEERQS